MRFREGRTADAARLAHVFFLSVHEGESPYTEAERKAWLPKRLSAEEMAKRIQALSILVAEDETGIVGFLGWRSMDGYIDFVFILPDARGKGVFRQMCEVAEKQAMHRALPRLWTHASLMAQPAFKAVGFRVIHHETLDRADQKLRRALMEKELT